MSPATILTVDDDSLILAYLEVLLEPEGYNVVKARSAQGALAFMAERVPDLLIVDVAMPGGTGLDLCKTLRGRRELEWVPIIVHTGSANLQKFSDSDLYDYAFQKGTDPEVLLRAIRGFVIERQIATGVFRALPD